MKSFSDSYKAAGVDVTAGYKAVELMKEHTRRTMIPGVLSGLGGFGGLFGLDVSGMREPVLVSGTDGVGTKLKLAFLMDKHDTIGIDCVAMCVNDIVCAGAKPLFFLDYIACGKNCAGEDRLHRLRRGGGLRPVRAAPSSAARPPRCPASMPEDEYDLAGFYRGRGGQGEDPGPKQCKGRGRHHRPCLPAAFTATAFPWSGRFSICEGKRDSPIPPSWEGASGRDPAHPHKTSM